MKRSDILIVDDTKPVISAIRRATRNESIDLHWATNGEDALKLVSNIDVKVIIADAKMTKMDGFELLEKVHLLKPDVCRIIISGHSDVGLILNLVNQKGIDRYFTKPWADEALISAIHKGIGSYDLRKEVHQLRMKKTTPD